MGLISSLKETVDNTYDKKKVDEVTINNIKESLNKASEKLLMKINTNELDLDVKDLKDLASVYTQLTQETDNQTGETSTPQAPEMVADTYRNSGMLPVYKNVEDETLEVSQDDIAKLSEEDIDKMVKEQFIAQNQNNVKENFG